MKSQQIDLRLLDNPFGTGNRKSLLFRAAALIRLMGAGMVHKDAAHQLRGDAVELRTVLPLRVLLIDQLEVSLVDQRRRLQRVALTLSPQIVTRQPAQLAVNQR